MTDEKKLSACCQDKPKSKNGLAQGILFGLIPHTFCILFIVFTLVGSVLGATVAKKFLMIPHFFLFLVILSLFFATIAAWLYLHSHQCCSANGIKSNWKYLTILYSTTLLINVVFFYYIFPALTVATTNNSRNNIAINQTVSTLVIKVDIPCSGHAPLIIDELKKDQGVVDVNYIPQNTFEIKYNADTTAKEILELNIFKTYQATKV